MLLSRQAAKESPKAGALPDAEAIRTQLNLVLAHPLFMNSKRYPVLLAYTVEQTLLGNAADLKERTIGMEAFGRSPDYDVNLDPVVRTSAAEVRRRLIQYYYDPAHAGELIIELSAGSYVPVFRSPEPSPVNVPDANREPENDEPGEARGFNPSSVENSEISASSGSSLLSRVRRGLPIALSILLALASGIGIGHYRRPPAPSNLQRFWRPINSSHDPITYCLGEPEDSIDRRDRMPNGGGLDARDVLTLAHTIVPLVPRHGSFRVLSASDANFAQMREGPIVLIGAFDNAWTMLIQQNLPFGFDDPDGVGKLVDRENPQKSWTPQPDVPGRSEATDYAIVARIHDNVTGEPVIIAAGISGEGTEAASEVLYNPTYLDAMLARAPKDWEGKNLEAVIDTHVIEGNPGPPEILAVKSW
ncbi:MAG TPA: hypothetical protein VFF50_10425 [Candidatus Deferrimicrobiaceae bacterium]|nr:hypothetical protein [Candidatus Deferrimicrobiaceae bacterium]